MENVNSGKIVRVTNLIHGGLGGSSCLVGFLCSLSCLLTLLASEIGGLVTLGKDCFQGHSSHSAVEGSSNLLDLLLLNMLLTIRTLQRREI